MKKWMNKNENRIWMPYIVILAVVLLAELFFFNFSTWKTLGCEPQIIAKDVVSDEKGVFSTGYIEISDDVKNVNVELDIERYDRAKVNISLTDEGDYYAYELPQYTVVSGVAGSGYQNIYPFGKVNAIQVTVTVPEGTKANISAIEINAVRPFAFKILRVLVLYSILAFGYVLFSGSSKWMQPCRKEDRWQVKMIVGTILCLVILAGLLARSTPVCVNSPWPHHKQYQELARAIKQGTVVIGEKPDPALLAKENPYDTSALLAEGIPFKMDYALYNGNYYAYFGIVPEVLFYLPYYLLTGRDLQNYMVVFALYCAMVIGIFGAFRELIRRYAQNVPFAVYFILSLSVSLLPHYIFMVARPDIYNVCVMAGNTFIWLGTYFWMKAGNTGTENAGAENEGDRNKNRWIWYALGACCIACIMGCRPQMILYAILLFVLLILPNRMKGKTEWIAFLVPFVVIGALVFWYNYARFGSGFDFGATYSLTSNDMNHRGFNLSRTGQGLFSFLIQPPVINSTFPFLQSCELESNYMGKNIVEFSFGGIFMIYPLLLSLFYVVFGGWKNLKKEEKGWIFGLCLISLVVAAFDINAAGILQRYMSDMAFGFVVAAVFLLLILLEKYKGTSISSWMVKGIFVCVLIGMAMSFMVVITSADSICLENYNPKLFYEIGAYFKF